MLLKTVDELLCAIDGQEVTWSQKMSLPVALGTLRKSPYLNKV